MQSDSSGRFEREFFKVLREDMTAGGVVGGSEGGFSPADSITSSDFYATDDSRVPMSIFGGVLTRGGKTKCKKCKKGKKCKECKEREKKNK